MMRFMYYGGIPALVSENKCEGTSEFNPYGEWELEDVGNALKKIGPEDTSGHVVKLVAPYMHALPMDRKWKVVFMNRDINEIITSLLAMRTVWEHSPAEAISDAKMFLRRHQVPTLDVHYKDMLNYPKSVAAAISEFLEVDLDVDEAVKAVDPNARQKIKGVRHKNGEEPLLGFDFNRVVPEKEMDL